MAKVGEQIGEPAAEAWHDLPAVEQVVLGEEGLADVAPDAAVDAHPAPRRVPLALVLPVCQGPHAALRRHALLAAAVCFPGDASVQPYMPMRR